MSEEKQCLISQEQVRREQASRTEPKKGVERCRQEGWPQGSWTEDGGPVGLEKADGC